MQRGGLWAQVAKHFFPSGTFSLHLRQSEAILAPHQWAREANFPAEALGPITMVSEHLQRFNMHLIAKFSTVIADNHAAGQATVEAEFRPWALLGRD